MASREKSGGVLVLIGLFKLAKALLLVLLAVGALELRNRGDLVAPVLEIARAVHTDPDGRLVRWLVHQFAALSPHRLELISIATFFYAGLFVLEGTGLVLRKRWGEIVTIVITGSFIPLEIYEVVRRVNPVKIVFLVVNVAIVAYLIVRLRGEDKASHRRRESASPASERA